jgi:hypothetical protein
MNDLMPKFGGLPSIPDMYASLTPRKRSNVTVDTGLFRGWLVEKRVAREARISVSEASIENSKASQIEAVNRQLIGAATFGDQLDLARFKIKAEADMLNSDTIIKKAQARTEVSKSETAFFEAKMSKLDYARRAKEAKEEGLDFENEAGDNQ